MHHFSFEELPDVEDLMWMMHPDEDLQGGEQRLPHSALARTQEEKHTHGATKDRLSVSHYTITKKNKHEPVVRNVDSTTGCIHIFFFPLFLFI